LETLKQFLGLFDEIEGEIYEGKVKTNERIKELDEEIKAKREALGGKVDKKRRSQVTIVVLAEVDGPAEISLSYVVTNAKWSPIYDLRAQLSTSTKEESKLVVHYRASISQSTGENWEDVSLTLSTASPLVGTTIPELRPARVRPLPTIPVAPTGMMYRSPPPPPLALPAPMAPGAAPDSERSQRSVLMNISETLPPSPPPPPPPRMQALAAVVNNDEGAGSATFGIQGLSTIPSADNAGSSQVHKVTVAEVDLQAELEWIVVPKGLSSAFLQCRAKNTSEFVFLPGPTNIFMGTNFVAKSNLKHISPQESFTCSLGIDASLKVKYHPLIRKAKTTTTWTGPKTETTVFTQRITVKNTRQSKLRQLTIKDQVPISEEETIKIVVVEPVELSGGQTLAGSTKGTTGLESLFGGSKSSGNASSSTSGTVGRVVRWVQKNEDGSGGDAGNGFVEWVYEGVESGKVIDINLIWELTAPADVKWAEYR
jgi:uncharacterized protein (TIGR02231 family)